MGLLEQPVVRGDGLGRWSDEVGRSGIQNEDARAEVPDRIEVMTDDDDARALVFQLGHQLEALQLKAQVTDGQNLVDKQDVWARLYCNRKAEPQPHAGRIELP